MTESDVIILINEISKAWYNYARIIGDMHIDQSLHTISKNVGLFLTDKTPLNELFNKTVPKEKSDEELYPSLFGNNDFLTGQQWKKLCNIVHVAPSGENELYRAFEIESPDFEDILQYSSAITVGAEVLLTRNDKHFRFSSIAVMDCETFINSL